MTSHSHTDACTPYQEGRAAFRLEQTRNSNPYSENDNFFEWEAGFNYELMLSIKKPMLNAYSNEVYAALIVLAETLEARQQYVVAQDLRGLASGPERTGTGMAAFSTSAVLNAASERLAEMARVSERTSVKSA